MRGARLHRTPTTAVVLAAISLVLTGCSTTLPGRAAAIAAAKPAAAPLTTDEVSAATGTALQEFWRQTFPAMSGRPWTDITEFVPVRTDDPAAPTPPCVARAADVAGKAFYCPAADAVVWDASGLIPKLRDRFGPAAVVVVLAHEVGHAVQTRLDINAVQDADPGRYPTILLETMADCYAGVALRHLVNGGSAGLPVSRAERDDALLALIGFRDPLGVVSADENAHGNAFDRVSAFQDGYTDGAGRCAAMTLDNRVFTQRQFGSAADRARRGDLPLPQLLGAVQEDVRTWSAEVVGTRAPGWQAPPLRTGPSGACGGADLAAQGPARFCAADGSVSIERDQLAAMHLQFGDYASATLVVSRYGLATLRGLGTPTEGPAAGRGAVCLAGAYTGRLIDPNGDFALSPGDLDEAVEVLLAGDWATRDAHGVVDAGEDGFERVGRYRTGVVNGPEPCLRGS